MCCCKKEGPNGPSSLLTDKRGTCRLDHDGMPVATDVQVGEPFRQRPFKRGEYLGRSLRPPESDAIGSRYIYGMGVDIARHIRKIACNRT